LVYEGCENLLSGDAGEPKAVGGFTLPDIEGSMLCG
jgi:hypothetical protein